MKKKQRRNSKRPQAAGNPTLEPAEAVSVQLDPDPSLSAPVGRNARRTARLPFNGQVEVRAVFSGPARVEVVDNASVHGVFVATAEVLEVGDPVVLTFEASGGAKIIVNGRVRWVSPFGSVSDAKAGMGIEFVGLDEVRRAQVDALLRRAG